MFVVIAKIKARDGEAEKLGDILTSMVDWVTENEADTLTYISKTTASIRKFKATVFYYGTSLLLILFSISIALFFSRLFGG